MSWSKGDRAWWGPVPVVIQDVLDNPHVCLDDGDGKRCASVDSITPRNEYEPVDAFWGYLP
jgi:hypothetical protein